MHSENSVLLQKLKEKKNNFVNKLQVEIFTPYNEVL